jgi:hypothetical protein
LVRTVKLKKETGRIVELHNILSFDISKLAQAKEHSYTGKNKVIKTYDT